jgi:hypothetical protein
MHKALWIARKNYLCTLIKKVSEGNGGDDIEFLRKHCKEAIKAHPDELIEEAIVCYQEMIDKLKYYPDRIVDENK